MVSQDVLDERERIIKLIGIMAVGTQVDGFSEEYRAGFEAGAKSTINSIRDGLTAMIRGDVVYEELPKQVEEGEIV